MRVRLTVTVAPFLATLLAEHGTAQEIARAEVMSDVMSWLTIAALMAASLLGGFALWLIRLPNCWFLGSIITVAIVYALLLTLPVPSMFLALAPAGIAEMALTGKVLGVDAALITGVQVVRILMVTLGAAWACRLFERLVGR